MLVVLSSVCGLLTSFGSIGFRIRYHRAELISGLNAVDVCSVSCVRVGPFAQLNGVEVGWSECWVRMTRNCEIATFLSCVSFWFQVRIENCEGPVEEEFLFVPFSSKLSVRESRQRHCGFLQCVLADW